MTHMNHEDMKLGEFAAWLRSLPMDTRFLEGRPSMTCPIAKYSGRPSAEFVGMPDWACSFIRRFDNSSKSDMKTALAVLKRVEAQYPA